MGRASTLLPVLALVLMLNAAVVCGQDEGIPPPSTTEVKPSEEPLCKLYRENLPAIVRVNAKGPRGAWLGTGFVISKKGLIVTNHHVIEGATEATISFSDGRSMPVLGCMAAGHRQDIALLMIDPTGLDLHVLKLAKEDPPVGVKVVAIGNPHGWSMSMTDGIVNGVRSGKDAAGVAGENHRYAHPDNVWIQTSTPISGGNSGGPLLLMDGTVTGVNTWGETRGQNLNFAASARKVRELVGRAADKPVPLREFNFGSARVEIGGGKTKPDPGQPTQPPKITFQENWWPKKRYSRQQIIAKIGTARAGLVCRKCNGTGTKTVRVYRSYDPIPGVIEDAKVDHDEKVSCPQCGGTGKCSSAATFVRLKYMVEAMMLANTKRFTKMALEQTRETARALFRKAAMNRGSSASICNDAAAKMFEKPEKHKGKPVIFYGYVAKILDHGDTKLCLMIAHGSEQVVIVRIRGEPNASQGNYALVGGLCAGVVTIGTPDGVFRDPGVEAWAIEGVK